MLVSEPHRFAFIHAPKTGGSSITAALAPILNRYVWVRPQGDEPYRTLADESSHFRAIGEHGWQVAYHEDHMHDVPLWKMGEMVARGFRFATFVRNPWDLMVSLWRHHALAGESLEGFATRWTEAPGSLKNHGQWYISGTGKNHRGARHLTHVGLAQYARPHCRFIGRYENLEDDFQAMCQEFDLGDFELPHQNAHPDAARHKPWREEYTKRTVELVGQIWQADIDRFGYEPPVIA